MNADALSRNLPPILSSCEADDGITCKAECVCVCVMFVITLVYVVVFLIRRCL